MIIHEIISDTLPRLKNRSIKEIRIGLSFTAVQLDNGSCGLASAPHPLQISSCTVVDEAGSLKGRSAEELIHMAQPGNPIATGIALATVNASLNTSNSPDPGIGKCVDIDGAVIGLVGHIAPLVPVLESRAKKLYVFDRRPLPAPTLPEARAPELLPGCDLVIFTSQTLVNGTLDDLLSMVSGEIVMMGPTTPMWAGFARHGISHLFGRKVVDVNAVLDIVSQGGGTRQFSPYTDKIHEHLPR
jgi:uncharacterized protein (DUF4213/DUF364 family)